MTTNGAATLLVDLGLSLCSRERGCKRAEPNDHSNGPWQSHLAERKRTNRSLFFRDLNRDVWEDDAPLVVDGHAPFVRSVWGNGTGLIQELDKGDTTYGLN